MTRLILIRHAETDWNVEGRYQGQSDVPLNERGRMQADKMAQSLAPAGLAAIYSSDLARAQETAEALARATALPVRIDPRLREIDQGEWEGMPFTDILARYPQELARRRDDPLAAAAPGGETVLQVMERVLEAVRKIIRQHPRDTVAIVSHGLPLAIVRTHYGGYPIGQVWDLIPENSLPLLVKINSDAVEC